MDAWTERAGSQFSVHPSEHPPPTGGEKPKPEGKEARRITPIVLGFHLLFLRSLETPKRKSTAVRIARLFCCVACLVHLLTADMTRSQRGRPVYIVLSRPSVPVSASGLGLLSSAPFCLLLCCVHERNDTCLGVSTSTRTFSLSSHQLIHPPPADKPARNALEAKPQR